MNMKDGPNELTTVAQFAEKQGIDYVLASGLIRYLEAKGIAKKGGQQPPKGGKGKPSTLYVVPTTVTLNFG